MIGSGNVKRRPLGHHCRIQEPHRDRPPTSTHLLACPSVGDRGWPWLRPGRWKIHKHAPSAILKIDRRIPFKLVLNVCCRDPIVDFRPLIERQSHHLRRRLHPPISQCASWRKHSEVSGYSRAVSKQPLHFARRQRPVCFAEWARSPGRWAATSARRSRRGRVPTYFFAL